MRGIEIKCSVIRNDKHQYIPVSMFNCDDYMTRGAKINWSVIQNGC